VGSPTPLVYTFTIYFDCIIIQGEEYYKLYIAVSKIIFVNMETALEMLQFDVKILLKTWFTA